MDGADACGKCIVHAESAGCTQMVCSAASVEQGQEDKGVDLKGAGETQML